MYCKDFLVAVTKKVLEKSPLRHLLVRGLGSLDPRQMCSKPDECLEGFKKVLNSLTAAKRVSGHQRDTALAQYAELLQERRHNLQQFERTSDSLDMFLYDLQKISSSYSDLWKLDLSRGQVSVERGSCVNRQVAVENMKELSYVSM
ncbi:hypothetical protein HPB48_009705 [Haemaphysalis longicornis]|uniref:Uncharacterized protein n=1 Tax=Haemaphysalis longicornis TaxID=44386 RepID=A0A9J6G9K4_HAELO|nr:hypothetical protein HPB48_009705 [Haemaphysalis longicornis]